MRDFIKPDYSEFLVDLVKLLHSVDLVKLLQSEIKDMKEGSD